MGMIHISTNFCVKQWYFSCAVEISFLHTKGCGNDLFILDIHYSTYQYKKGSICNNNWAIKKFDKRTSLLIWIVNL